MDIGPILALLSAMFYAGSQVLVRRGVYQAKESFTSAAVVVFVGMLLCIFILPFGVDWNNILPLSWHVLLILGAAGMTSFVGGIFLLYSSIRLLGANKAGAITRTNILLTVIIGIVVLHEPVTVSVILGGLCIMVGVVLVSFERKKGVFKLQSKGVLYGVGSAICTGGGSILVKLVIDEIGSPLAAAFISYVAACLLLILIFLCHTKKREQLFQLRRSSLAIFCLAGIFVLVAHLSRYAALGYSPVSVVQPLVGTVVLFVFIFSFLVNRKIDLFNWRVFTGIVAVVLGTFLLFL